MQVAFGENFAASVSSERIQRRILSARPILGISIDAATRGKNKGTNAGLFRFPRQFDSGFVVNLEGDVLINVAHGIIRDRGQINDGVDVLQQFLGKMPNIAEVLCIKAAFRQEARSGQAGSEITGVKAGEECFRAGIAQLAHDQRPDVSHIAGDKNLHRAIK